MQINITALRHLHIDLVPAAAPVQNPWRLDNASFRPGLVGAGVAR